MDLSPSSGPWSWGPTRRSPYAGPRPTSMGIALAAAGLIGTAGSRQVATVGTGLVGSRPIAGGACGPHPRSAGSAVCKDRPTSRGQPTMRSGMSRLRRVSARRQRAR